MRKALRWLDDHHIDYQVHDYKNKGIDLDILKKAMDIHGWENVINRKSTTWRQIPQKERDSMSREQAELLADAKPSVIKRPIIAKGDDILIGFDTDTYSNILL